MQKRFPALCALAVSLISVRAFANLTVWLRASDDQSKKAQERILDLLDDGARQEPLPEGGVKFTARGWTAKIDRRLRDAAIESLKAEWGERLQVETDGEKQGQAGAAKVKAAGQAALALVPTALVSGQQATVYDNNRRADGAASVQTPPARAAVSTALKAAKPSGLDLSALDRSVSPCADFYQYSCGGWLKSNPIPGDQSRWGRFSELHERNQKILKGILEQAAAVVAAKGGDEKKLGDLYASCMDEKRVEKKGAGPIRGDLDRIARLSERGDLAVEVARLHKKGVGALFNFGSEQDFEDASMAIGAIDQGGLSLPDRDYYLEAKFADDLKAYGKHVARMFELSGDRPAQAQTEAGRVLAVETALARVSLDRVSRRDPAKTHRKMALRDFERMAKSFDWGSYFAELGAPKMKSLDVNSMVYFSAFGKAYAAMPLEALKSYLRWHVVHAHAGMLSSAFADESFAFFERRLSGQKEQKARWKRCADVADSVMGEALGRGFVKQAFDGGAKDATLKLVGEIEAAMDEDIRGVAWMSPQTQKKALEKLAQVANKIGYPDKWRDYSKLKVSRGDAVGNLERAAAFETRRDLAKIGKPADRKEWQMTPPTVNAYYDPSNNDMNFPAGILQPPFYDAKADDAANLGGIGAVIGHELTHGFDDEGRQFDGKGNLNDWWTDQDQAAFEKRAQGLVDQYSKFVASKDPGGDPTKDVHVNGKLTLGENTADNGGIRLAYAAFLKEQAVSPSGVIDGFTPAQRFFLGFGQVWCQNATDQKARLLALTDPHSPPRFRVDGTLSNMAEFRQAFSCGAGDAMVNPTPARVW